MPVSYVGSVQAPASGPRSSQAVADLSPVDVQPNDTLLALTLNGSNRVPPGWQRVGESSAPSFLGAARIVASVRQAAAGDPDLWTFEVGMTIGSGVVVLVLRDADPAGPIAAVAGGQVPVAPPVTSPSDGARLVSVWTSVDDVGWSGPSSGQPRQTLQTSSPRGPAQMLVSDQPVPAGPTPPVTAQAGPVPSWAPQASLSVLVAPGYLPPHPPTLLDPQGIADLSEPVTLAVQFRDPNPGDVQAGVAWRRRPLGDGDWQWWDGTGWVATEAWLATDEPTVVTPPWGNGQIWEWSAASEDQLGLRGPYADPAMVEGSTRPTVSVTGPESPVEDTSRPAITWSYADDQSQPQDAFEVRLFAVETTVVPGFAPGQTSGLVATSGVRDGTTAVWVPSGPLDNAVPYVAYVRVRKPNGLWSTWGDRQFVLDLVLPDAPSLSAVADGPAGHVVVTAGSDVPGALVTVERLDGERWVEVRGGPLVEAGVLVDREAPAGEAVYRARTVVDFDGLELHSTSTTVTATLTLDRTWLTDPVDPAVGRPIRVTIDPTIAEPEGLGEHQGVGARYVTFTADAIRGRRLSVTVLLQDRADHDALRALRGNQHTLLLRSQDGMTFYGRIGADAGAELMPVGKGWNGLRRVSFELVEQARP